MKKKAPRQLWQLMVMLRVSEALAQMHSEKGNIPLTRLMLGYEPLQKMQQKAHEFIHGMNA
ncbi:MAG: hypothetical protein QXV09_01755 [Candidatus Bathyarchaeia archaeon]